MLMEVESNGVCVKDSLMIPEDIPLHANAEINEVESEFKNIFHLS